MDMLRVLYVTSIMVLLSLTWNGVSGDEMVICRPSGLTNINTQLLMVRAMLCFGGSSTCYVLLLLCCADPFIDVVTGSICQLYSLERSTLVLRSHLDHLYHVCITHFLSTH